jgi:hypothetical protein
MTDAFSVYTMYLALKQHFTTESYDYFKYHGRVKANKESFLRRRDRYFFHKISKKKDPLHFLLANFVEKGDFYIGDNPDDEVYLKWKGTQEKLTYNFKNEIGQLDEPFYDNFKTDGQHPHALQLFYQNKISKETLIIINDVFRNEIFDYWNEAINDPVVWPQTQKLLRKYKPFLSYDKKKIFSELVDLFPELRDK